MSRRRQVRSWTDLHKNVKRAQELAAKYDIPLVHPNDLLPLSAEPLDDLLNKLK
jgi:hypothetical protein